MATSNPMVPTPTNHGMGHEEALYRGIALAQLRILKQQMQLGGLFIGNRSVRLDNGVEILASICGNKEDIYVRVPVVTPPVSTNITEEHTYLVCSPRTVSDNIVFPLTSDAFNRQTGLKIKNGDDGLVYYPPAITMDITGRGNYHLFTSDGKAYSITAPPHHLASDPQSSLVPGYNRFAWAGSSSGNKVYTCYSEYVYSQGKPVFAGTMAPTESAFKYSLIVGMGLDDKDVLHIAQLVQVPKDYGYWKIEKDGSNLGTFFGTFAAASEKGAATLIWKNESDDKSWFIEFLTCDNGLNVELVTNLNIYRREDGARYGNRQWFYKDGEWFQYTSSIPAKLTFGGLQYEGGLKKTRYSQVLDAALVNSKPVVASHFANSLSGVVGDYEEVQLPVKVIAANAIDFNASSTWPAVNSAVEISAYGPCNSVSVALQNLTNFEVQELEENHKYLVTRLDLGSTCNSYEINGAIIATGPANTESLAVYVAGNTPTPVTVAWSGSGSQGAMVVGDYITASGGTAPYSFSISAGSVNQSTGQITGIPSCPTSTGVATVTDSCGRSGSTVVRFAVASAGWYTVATQDTSCPDYAYYNNCSVVSPFIVGATRYSGVVAYVNRNARCSGIPTTGTTVSCYFQQSHPGWNGSQCCNTNGTDFVVNPIWATKQEWKCP